MYEIIEDKGNIKIIDETTDNPFIVPVNTMIPGTYTF